MSVCLSCLITSSVDKLTRIEFSKLADLLPANWHASKFQSWQTCFRQTGTLRKSADWPVATGVSSWANDDDDEKNEASILVPSRSHHPVERQDVSANSRTVGLQARAEEDWQVHQELS